MIIKRLGPQVVAVDYTVENPPEWSASSLFMSDVHFDATGCDRAMLVRHLDKAKKTGSKIFILGDFWDAMQGRSDRRGSKSALRDEYLASHYFNAIVDDAVEFLEPYMENIAAWALGNHETAVMHHHEIDQ